MCLRSGERIVCGADSQIKSGFPAGPSFPTGRSRIPIELDEKWICHHAAQFPFFQAYVSSRVLSRALVQCAAQQLKKSAACCIIRGYSVGRRPVFLMFLGQFAIWACGLLMKNTRSCHRRVKARCGGIIGKPRSRRQCHFGEDAISRIAMKRMRGFLEARGECRRVVSMLSGRQYAQSNPTAATMPNQRSQASTELSKWAI